MEVSAMLNDPQKMVHRSTYPVKLPDSNQHVKLATGQTINGVTFAGKGTDTEIRDRFRLEST